MTGPALLQHLLELAAQEQHALQSEDLEAALELRGQYDAAMTKLQEAVASAPLGRDQRPALEQLVRLHESNTRLVEGRRDEMARSISDVSSMRRLTAYAPLGADHKPVPRYLDASA